MPVTRLRPNPSPNPSPIPGLRPRAGPRPARALREHPQTAKAVLVAVTGYGQESDRERAYAAGFDHHLAKPARVKDLLAVLDQRRPSGAPDND